MELVSEGCKDDPNEIPQGEVNPSEDAIEPIVPECFRHRSRGASYEHLGERTPGSEFYHVPRLLKSRVGDIRLGVRTACVERVTDVRNAWLTQSYILTVCGFR